MTDIRRPRRGSMAFRPRKRAARQVPDVYWQSCDSKRVLGFAGYKAGMTHASYIDNSESPTKGQEVVGAATVIEVPPLYVSGIRCYSKGYGAQNDSIGDILISDSNILKVLGAKKAEPKKFDEAKATDVRLLVYSQPDKTRIGKKHVEKFELGVGGKDVAEKLEYAKSLLGKELRVKDLFKPGEFLDVIAVTKGKGWQGAVKRFGVSLQRPKATGKRRHVGTLGQWHPAYVLYTVPQAGQMGYHTRTELNKFVLKIGDKPEDVNPSGGFLQYGFVKNDYLLLKGSIPGPVKRLVRLRLGVRSGNVQPKDPTVSFVSVASLQ